MNNEFLIELWSTFRGYIDKNYIETAAYQFIELIMEHNEDNELLNHLREMDINLEHAINEFNNNVEIIGEDEEM